MVSEGGGRRAVGGGQWAVFTCHVSRVETDSAQRATAFLSPGVKANSLHCLSKCA